MVSLHRYVLRFGSESLRISSLDFSQSLRTPFSCGANSNSCLFRYAAYSNKTTPQPVVKCFLCSRSLVIIVTSFLLALPWLAPLHALVQTSAAATLRLRFTTSMFRSRPRMRSASYETLYSVSNSSVSCHSYSTT